MNMKPNNASNTSNPFKVSKDPGFIRDASPQRLASHNRIRQEQEATSQAHKRLIGNLESLSSEFQQIISALMSAKQKLSDNKKVGLTTAAQDDTIIALTKDIDKMVSYLGNTVLPRLDDLGE